MKKIAERLMKKIAMFFDDEAAATAIEYAMIASLVSIVIVASVGNLGSSLTSTYERIRSLFQ